MKVILGLLGFVVGLLIIIVIALQFPQVQNYIANKGAAYLSDTLDTEVRIGGFTTDWRNTLVLKEVYVEDQQQDTLWYSERLGVDMRIFSLLSGELNIGEVNLQNATLKLHIREDSTTNFDFLTEAFATDTAAAPQPADTTSAAMKIALGTVILDNVYVVFRDEAGGNYIKTRVGELETTMDEIDLDAQRYLVDEIELANTWVNYEQTKLPPPDTAAYEPLEMEFGLNRVALENIRVSYLSYPSDQSIELALGESELVADNINLKDARVDLESFMLRNTDVKYVQKKFTPTDSLAVNPVRTAEELDESVEDASGQPMNWVMTLGEMDVTDLDVQFDTDAPKQTQGMDYDHLLFTDVVLDAQDILFSLNRIRVDLNQFTLKEQSGFNIQNFNANIVVDSTSASLKNLDLKTGNSHLQNDLAMTYPSLEAITENPSQVGLKLDVNNSYVGMQDIQYFMPDLAKDPAFKSIANSTIKFEAEAVGQLDNLRIETLQVAGLKDTYVDVSGTVRNAMDPDKLYMDLNIDRFTTTRTDILALAPAGTIPPDFRIPNQISLEGKYEGTLTAFDAKAELRSSFGNVDAVVDMDANENFTATVRSGSFDLGQLMTDSLGLGKVALVAKASGNGLTPETMQAVVEADVKLFDYNGYSYNDIDVNARIDRGLYQVEANAEDENLNFDLTGTFNMRDSLQAAYAFNLDLREADLQALNLYPEPLAVQGQLQGEFTGADASTLSGTLQGEQLVINYNETTYPIDTLLLTLEQAGEVAELDLKSDIADAEMHFENTLATLPTALQKYFSYYFDLQPDPPYPTEVNLKDFRFAVDVKRTNLITAFVPGLTQLQIDSAITGAYNAQTQELVVDGHVNTIAYTDYVLRDLDLRLRGDENELNYNLELQRLLSPSLQMQNVTLEGTALDDALTIRLAIAGDSVEQDRLVLGGTLNSEGKGYRFSFNPDQLVINGDEWDVPQDNYLQFGTNILYANNIVLQYNNQAIALNSTGPVRPNAPLNVGFDNVDIGYIMSTFQEPQDSLIAGTINGEATLNDIMSGTLSFTSDLAITDLVYEGTPVGDLALEASSTGGNRYNIDARLTDNGNQVLVDGFVETQPNATLLNLRANIPSLNMASLEGFTAGMVNQLDGRASGDLRITGTVENPDIIGELNFDQAQFNITMFGSLFTLEDERLVFNEQGIRFPNFTITDTLGNDLLVEGLIATETYTDFRFDLNVDTDRFLALNSTAANNDLFYGTLFVAADATISGTMAVPVVRVDVRVLDGSDFTTVMPAESVGAAEREGIVEFVNLSPELDRIISRPEEQDSVEVTGFVGADVEAEITVTETTPITIVIDPVTGDNLVVRGTADPLFIGMRPSGEINMSGRYTIESGRYSMDFYDLASRELEIAEGSYIVWSGDPLQGTMDITAIYNVETAPQELVASQVAGTQNPALKNQTEFQVLVSVEGDLLTPEISFDIQLAEGEERNVPEQVVTSLGNLRQDEAELNKQVFALLVLGRFLAPDPLASSGGGLEASARNSLSGVLTDQLNAITNRYAGGLGLELGVDSYEDYSSGSAQGRTDLNVALKQQFLNDRLTVRVGTDIGLEGGNQSNQTMSGFGGDISVEYSLTEDGRLRVRGFQRNQYEGVLEGGDVRATGVSLIYVREYNDFADLFRSVEEVQRREEARNIKEAERFRQKQAIKEEEQELKEEGIEQ